MSTDPSTPSAETPSSNALAPNWATFTRLAATAAIAGAALYLITGIANLAAAGEENAKHAQMRFASSYLTGFIYWFSLPIGAMALLMIAYLVKSSWGLLLRRPLEAATRTLPVMVILWIPLAGAVATNTGSPYWWTNPEETPIPPDVSANPAAGVDPADKRKLAEKYGEYMIAKAVDHERKERAEGNNGFLSAPAFIGVSLALFLIWGLLIFFLDKWGKEASDENNPARVDAALEKLKNLSGPGIIIYALTITAAATQWVMSVEPAWSSTMFPVIFAVNQFLTCYAFCLALFLYFSSKPPIQNVLRPKFQLDMGTLLLAFTMFWSYTSFSQFMLIWIGNLPEEIPFYLKRSNYDGHRSGWWYVSAALIVLHFALPFLLLLFRDIKLHPVRLRMVATYLLVICAVDVIWWIAPAIPAESAFFWLMDVGAIIGIGGVWGLFWIWQLKQRPLIPASQVFLLPEGHHHEHH